MARSLNIFYYIKNKVQEQFEQYYLLKSCKNIIFESTLTIFGKESHQTFVVVIFGLGSRLKDSKD